MPTLAEMRRDIRRQQSAIRRTINPSSAYARPNPRPVQYKPKIVAKDPYVETMEAHRELVRQRQRAEGAEKTIRDYADSAHQAKRMLKRMVAQQEATIQRRVASAAAAAAIPRQVERVFVNVHDLTGDDSEEEKLEEAEKAPLVKMPSLVQDEVAKEGESECGLCMSNKAIILVAPCGHSSLCYGCASQVVKSGKKECPFCRGKIEAVYHIKMI